MRSLFVELGATIVTIHVNGFNLIIVRHNSETVDQFGGHALLFG